MADSPLFAADRVLPPAESTQPDNSATAGPGWLRLGSNVRARRNAAGMTLDALARPCGVSKAMRSQVEQGKANPTLAAVCKTSAALRLDLADLIDSPDARHAIRNPARTAA